MKAGLQGGSPCSASASWAELTPGMRSYGQFWGAPMLLLQCQGAHVTSAVLGCPWWCCNAGVPTAPLQCQGTLWGTTDGQGGVSRSPQGLGLSLEASWPSCRGNSSDRDTKSLHNFCCKTDAARLGSRVLAMKSSSGRRFLSYEMHLLITLQKSSLPSVVLLPLSFSVLPLTCLQAFRDVSTQAAKRCEPCCLS